MAFPIFRRLRSMSGEMLVTLVLALSSALPVPVVAQGLPYGEAMSVDFVEHSEVRKSLFELIRAPVNEWLRQDRRTYEQRFAGSPVRVEVRQNAESVYLLFANRVGSRFPIYSQGTYIIKRDRSDGAFIQTKVFLRTDPEFFTRIFPQGAWSSMNVYVAGQKTYGSVRIPVPFQDVLVLPFRDIMEMTSGVVRWELIVGDNHDPRHRAVREMAGEVRSKLASYRRHRQLEPEEGAGAAGAPQDAEEQRDARGDGGQEGSDRKNGGRHGRKGSRHETEGARQHGLQVESLHSVPLRAASFAFVKWVADGIYSADTGRFLSNSALEERHPELRGHNFTAVLEEGQNPYLALDWSRNLAHAVNRAAGEREGDGVEASDVRRAAFSRYVEDAGYPVGELRRVLFSLAASEPGHFYVGSINGGSTMSAQVREHRFVALFFPYFAEDGSFHAPVMIAGEETSLQALEQAERGSAVHLVRLPAAPRYSPPSLHVTALP